MFKNTRINGFVQKERVQAAYNMRGGWKSKRSRQCRRSVSCSRPAGWYGNKRKIVRNGEYTYSLADGWGIHSTKALKVGRDHQWLYGLGTTHHIVVEE